MADINVAPGILQAPANLYSQILGNQASQAATQGQQLQNAQAAYNLKWLMGMDQASKGGGQAIATPQGSAAEDQSGVDQAGNIDKGVVASHVDGQFQQGQYIPSPQTAAFNAAAAQHGFPQIGAARIAQEKAAWDGQMQQRQIGANAELQQVYSLQDAVKAGNGITALRDIPNGGAEAAAHLEAKAKELGWDDKTLNAHVGDWADAVGGAVFRHTGREISDNNGTPYDKQAGRPVPGGVKAPLSSSQLAAAYTEAGDPVTLGAGLPEKRYLAFGFKRPEDYVAAKNAATVQGVPFAPADAPVASKGAAQAPATAAAAQPTAQPGAAPGAPNAGTAAPIAGVKPGAFADPAFARKPIPTPTDQLSLQKAQEQQKLNIANDNALLAKVNANAGIANMTKPYLDLARSYLESGGVITGMGAEQALELSKLAAKAGIPASWLGDPAKTEEVIKNTAQAAVQGARGNFGSNMSTNEVNLSMTKLNPYVHQEPAAMLNLIKEAQAQAQYDQDTAKLAPQYLAHGNDPLRFEDWQHDNHDRSQFVQKQTGRQATQTVGGVTYYKKDGKWFKENG